MMTVKTTFGTYENCYLKEDRYMADGSLCITVCNDTEGEIARLTVFLDDPKISVGQAYVDTISCPWAEDFIREYQLGKPVGKLKRSGFCKYPLYEFDLTEIRKWWKE